MAEFQTHVKHGMIDEVTECTLEDVNAHSNGMHTPGADDCGARRASYEMFGLLKEAVKRSGLRMRRLAMMSSCTCALVSSST